MGNSWDATDPQEVLAELARTWFAYGTIGLERCLGCFVEWGLERSMKTDKVILFVHIGRRTELPFVPSDFDFPTDDLFYEGWDDEYWLDDNYAATTSGLTADENGVLVFYKEPPKHLLGLFDGLHGENIRDDLPKRILRWEEEAFSKLLVLRRLAEPGAKPGEDLFRDVSLKTGSCFERVKLGLDDVFGSMDTRAQAIVSRKHVMQLNKIEKKRRTVRDNHCRFDETYGPLFWDHSDESTWS